MDGVSLEQRNVKYDKMISYVSTALLCLISLISLLWNSMRPIGYLEIDSYVMPIISIQYRGSIIVEQQDIDQARIDFPSLYANVYQYDDLRVSKLCKINDEQWIAFYFPLYALLCLPMKLLLQFLKLNQEYAFTLTNSLFFILASAVSLKRYSGNKLHSLLFTLLLCCFPMLWYIGYIGAEPILYCLTVIAYILWKEGRYKTTALLISIACTTNPTYMAIGIVMFLEYIFRIYLKDKNFYKDKTIIKETLILCSCYIPSLIPFIINKVLLNVWNPTATSSFVMKFVGDSLLRRFLSYLFDLNFGVPSISIVALILFLAAIVWSIIKKQRMLIFEWVSVLFTIFCFSIMYHINCGMYICARYIFWIYPAILIVAFDFIFAVKIKEVLKICSVGLCIFNYIINAELIGFYHYTSFSNLSVYILDRFPSLYISFSDSTFTSRVNHIDGGYNSDTYSIYYDSENGNVRKILYRGTEENHKVLLGILASDEDVNLDKLRENFSDDVENKNYYLNFNRSDKAQYRMKYSYTPKLLETVNNLGIRCTGLGLDTLKTIELAGGLAEGNEADIEYIYSMISTLGLNDQEYVHLLYQVLLYRDESETENSEWVARIAESEDGRLNALKYFISSDEFIFVHNIS